MNSELAIRTNTDLDNLDARRTALVTLNQAAEQATDPVEARRIMLQAKAIADLLESAKVPFEEARLAGKASVVAGRKVGRFLEKASPIPPSAGRGKGRTLSDRGLLREELGLSKGRTTDLIRLARLEDPDFQRYIQLTDRIPSIHGCLANTHPEKYPKHPSKGSWQSARRNRVGVKLPKNPSLEEGHSLVVRSLGHLSAAIQSHGFSGAKRDISGAIDHLYAAEDLLRPHLGGYTSRNPKDKTS